MNDDLPALPSLPLGLYRHYKGGEYQVIGVARHSETLEPHVVYRPLYNATGLWLRPFAMFVGTVMVDGCERMRFDTALVLAVIPASSSVITAQAGMTLELAS
eukprot:gene6682-8502_t